MTYGYDLLGRMISASQSGDSLTFAWDSLGRQLSQTEASGTYSSAYDLAGRRTRLTHPDGFFVDQDYLVTGEMVAIRENGATSGVGVLATYAYDDLGRRTLLTLGNGAVTDYGYDAVSRLSTLVHDLAGSTYDNTVTFAYNPASQIVSTTRSNDLYAWTGQGSGTTSTTADGLNRIPSWNSTLSYDAKGNMTYDGTKTYTYDSENRAATVNGFAYYYDPLGRLAGVGSPLALAYENYVDGLIAERTPGSSSVSRRHVFGPGIDEPIVWYEGSGTSDRRFLSADERGSIVAVTDGSGAVRNVNRYDENGRVQYSDPYYLDRFAFTGQRYFSGNGTYYYKNRLYDPKSGRFMQPDPIGYAAGMNLYAYVGGDPVNSADPMGLAPQHLECTGTRLCKVHDSSGNVSGSVGVFADVNGFGGGGAASGGKDTSNYDKGASKNIGFDLGRPVQVADALNWTSVLEGAQTAGKWTLRGVAGIETGACFLLSGACGLEEQRMSLYRVVDATELNIIRTTGTYGFNPNGSGKYFGFSPSQTENLFNTIYKTGGSLTEITLPTRIIFQGHEFNDPGGAGPSVHFSDQQLPTVYKHMTPIRVIYTRTPR